MNWFKKLRLKENLTQAEMANTLDVTQGYISKVESGSCSVSFQTLVDLRRTFKINVNRLLDSGRVN